MKRLVFGCAIFMVVLANPSVANTGRVGGWWEYGNETCAGWLAARDAQGADELIYRAWVDGYFAGLRHEAAKPPNGPHIASWMDSYCRDHPSATLRDAVRKFRLRQ